MATIMNNFNLILSILESVFTAHAYIHPKSLKTKKKYYTVKIILSLQNKTTKLSIVKFFSLWDLRWRVQNRFHPQSIERAIHHPYPSTVVDANGNVHRTRLQTFQQLHAAVLILWTARVSHCHIVPLSTIRYWISLITEILRVPFAADHAALNSVTLQRFLDWALLCVQCPRRFLLVSVAFFFLLSLSFICAVMCALSNYSQNILWFRTSLFTSAFWWKSWG